MFFISEFGTAFIATAVYTVAVTLVGMYALRWRPALCAGWSTVAGVMVGVVLTLPGEVPPFILYTLVVVTTIVVGAVCWHVLRARRARQ